MNKESCHVDILSAAVLLVKEKGKNEFSPKEIINYFAEHGILHSPGTVRVHINSRCCISSNNNHGTTYEYFERLARGQYKVRHKYL